MAVDRRWCGFLVSNHRCSRLNTAYLPSHERITEKWYLGTILAIHNFYNCTDIDPIPMFSLGKGGKLLLNQMKTGCLEHLL